MYKDKMKPKNQNNPNDKGFREKTDMKTGDMKQKDNAVTDDCSSCSQQK